MAGVKYTEKLCEEVYHEVHEGMEGLHVNAPLLHVLQSLHGKCRFFVLPSLVCGQRFGEFQSLETSEVWFNVSA